MVNEHNLIFSFLHYPTLPPPHAFKVDVIVISYINSYVDSQNTRQTLSLNYHTTCLELKDFSLKMAYLVCIGEQLIDVMNDKW